MSNLNSSIVSFIPDTVGPGAAYLLTPPGSQTGTLTSGQIQKWTTNGSVEIFHAQNATSGPNAGKPDFSIYGQSYNYANLITATVGAAIVWDGTAWSPSNAVPALSSWAGLTDPSATSFNAGTSAAGGMGVTFASGALGTAFVLKGPPATASAIYNSPAIELDADYWTGTASAVYGLNAQVQTYSSTPKGFLQWNANVAGVKTHAMYMELDGNGNGMLFVGIGAGAAMLHGVSGGSNSVAFGPFALNTGTVSGGMTAIGANSLENATGDDATGLGYLTLNNLTTGSRMTAVGSQAGVPFTGVAPTTASDGIFIGYQTGFGLGAAQLNFASVIGNYGVVYDANTTVIGSISGVNGATVTVGLATPGGITIGYSSTSGAPALNTLRFVNAGTIQTPTNTGVALSINDSSTHTYYALNTQTATDSIQSHFFSTAGISYAQAATSSYHLVNIGGFTWTGTAATTTVTALNGLSLNIIAPTVAFSSANTVTTASTLYIGGPPIAGLNATITNPYAMYIDNAGNLGMTGGLLSNASSTLTNGNLAAFTSTSTALAAGNSLVTITSSGANGTSGITATGLTV